MRRSRATDIKFPWVDDTELKQTGDRYFRRRRCKTGKALCCCAPQIVPVRRDLAASDAFLRFRYRGGYSHDEDMTRKPSWQMRIALRASASPGNRSPNG